MICKICQKNPATIHIQEIINGEKKSLHICAECAAKKSKDDPLLQGFNIAEMLYSLSSQIPPPNLQEEESKEEAAPHAPLIACKVCGWDGNRFRKSGRLGCGHCYEVFKDVLAPALNNMHRGTLHVGKQPGGQRSNKSGKLLLRMMGMQKELDELVKREEYEKAAELRDKISALKKTLES